LAGIGKPMKRTQYIGSGDVASFIDWFARKVGDQSVRHSYVDRRTQRRVVFDGLCSALDQYRWNGKSYDQNADDLDKLRSGLAKAMKIEDRKERDKSVCASCVEVMEWGRVAPRNKKWLFDNEDGLASTIANVCGILRSEDDDLSSFPVNMRFNAGMTKIYSLLVSAFIIYDSRVAAALGWFVVQWLRELDDPTLPEPLSFPWMPAKEAPNAGNPKKRDPSCGPYNFPRVNGSAAHARWNLRASWILAEALRKSKEACFYQKGDPLRWSYPDSVDGVGLRKSASAE
jgi:hypothetical protein